MNRRINAVDLALVKQWEGLKTKAYRDVGGIWTIGYGHTGAAGAPAVTPNMVITEAKADEILGADLAKFEERVSRLVRVPLTG
jgi:lysozyme